MVVPGATVSVRRAPGSFGSVTSVSGTAMASHSSGMLARMEISVEMLKRTAALGGLDWSDAELQPIRPAGERLLDAPERLGALPPGDLEPETQHRGSC